MYAATTKKRESIIVQSTTSLYDTSSVICADIELPPSSPSSSYGTVSPDSYSTNDTVNANGYMPLFEVAKTLQGCVMKASRNSTTEIIKITNKCLYNQHVTIVNDKEVNIGEDILKEMQILKHLTSHHPPSSLAKYVDFFEDSKHFFLVMEDAGVNLFDFVKDCHQLIEKGLLDISVWHSFCKIAMKQMVEVVYWMHNKMHCCHLDISLENFAISNINMVIGDNDVRFNTDFQIKLIDFGLAEVFESQPKSRIIDFRSTKYVGKRHYKSPEVYAKKKAFNARSTDCWSLGVCFFMMIVGSPPFRSASASDNTFTLLMKGEYVAVLSTWRRIHYVTMKALDLIKKILVKEKYRLNIKQIKHHPFFSRAMDSK